MLLFLCTLAIRYKPAIGTICRSDQITYLYPRLISQQMRSKMAFAHICALCLHNAFYLTTLELSILLHSFFLWPVYLITFLTFIGFRLICGTLNYVRLAGHVFGLRCVADFTPSCADCSLLNFISLISFCYSMNVF